MAPLPMHVNVNILAYFKDGTAGTKHACARSCGMSRPLADTGTGHAPRLCAQTQASRAGAPQAPPDAGWGAERRVMGQHRNVAQRAERRESGESLGRDPLRERGRARTTDAQRLRPVAAKVLHEHVVWRHHAAPLGRRRDGPLVHLPVGPPPHRDAVSVEQQAPGLRWRPRTLTGTAVQLTGAIAQALRVTSFYSRPGTAAATRKV